MSIKIQSACWQINLPPTNKLVLVCLADFADDSGHCYPSAMLIAERTGLSESTTRRAIANLESLGHISRKYQTGRPTFYSVHPCHSDTPVIVTPLSEKQLTPVTVTSTPVREATDPCQRSKYNHQEPSLTISEPSIENRVAIAPPNESRGTRLPADWTLPADWITDANDIGLDNVMAYTEGIKFRDYWIGVAGAKGRKADWRATWRNWARRSLENKQRGQSHAERKHSLAEHRARRDYSPATTKDF